MKQSEFVDRIYNRYIDNEELKRLLITHSRCVADKALSVARECGLDDRIDRQFVVDAAMLHDIGVVECDAPGIHCFGTLPYIRHGIAGSEILEREGLDNRYCRVCERHTGAGISREDIRIQNLPLPDKDFLPETLEEKLICYADKFFSKSSHPETEKSLERVMASMRRHGDETEKRFLDLHETFYNNKKAAANHQG